MDFTSHHLTNLPIADRNGKDPTSLITIPNPYKGHFSEGRATYERAETEMLGYCPPTQPRDPDDDDNNNTTRLHTYADSATCGRQVFSPGPEFHDKGKC
jgi:hypothetical protein